MGGNITFGAFRPSKPTGYATNINRFNKAFRINGNLIKMEERKMEIFNEKICVSTRKFLNKKIFTTIIIIICFNIVTLKTEAFELSEGIDYVKFNIEEIKTNQKQINKIIDKIPQLNNKYSIENLMENNEKQIKTMKTKKINKQIIHKDNMPSEQEVIDRIIQGQYGNGMERQERLEAEGYNFENIQAKVTQQLQKQTKQSQQSKQTKSSSSANDTNNVNGTRMTMEATAYSTSQPELGRYTADGTDLHKESRVIAVDPRVIPLGTMVTIEGWGTYRAADTGSSIKGNRIDIHFDTVKECINFGRQKVSIIIHN